MKIYLQALRLEGVKVIYIFDYMLPTAQLKLLFTLTALILWGLSPAQNVPVLPIQDCQNAFIIPGPGLVYGNTPFAGPGNNANEINPAISCLPGEENSIWLRFCTTMAGEVSITINPDSSNADYNFAVYKLTGNTCADIYTMPELQVRCNNIGPFPTNITGANGGSMAQEEPVLNVLPGEQYYILLNRHYNGPNSGGGFFMNITGIGSDTTCFTTGVKDDAVIYMSDAPYPNPANNSITLNHTNLKQGQTGSIKLYNTSGVLVKQLMGISQHKTTIDIADLPSGLYYYTIYIGNQQNAGRFIKE